MLVLQGHCPLVLIHSDLSDLEAIEWIYKVPQAVLLLCNLVFLVWIMAVS